jgi:DNA-binding LacI/PurR family transcriptional regulator
VTLSDIAASLGISTMSVSRALRNQPRTSASLRDRVLKKAQEMGYRPDPALSALVQYRQGKTSTSINAVLAWFNQWPEPKRLRDFREFDLYWRGAQASAEKLGFRLEEFIVNEAMPPDRMKTILRTRDIRGILIPPGPFNHEWMGRFDWSGFSLVGMTKMPESLPIHSVTSHQVHNVMRAMAEMRARGYRRIGLVANAWTARGYYAGHLWDQLAHPDGSRIPACLLNEENHEAELPRFEAWWREHRPDAILTELPSIPGKLKAMGVRVPQDLGLAALTVLDCPIDAGIYQNPEEIGRVAVLVLASLINDGDVGAPRVKRQILIEGTWINGASLPDLHPQTGALAG